MDYTVDQCKNMFSWVKLQECRHYFLRVVFRRSLVNSLGCVPPITCVGGNEPPITEDFEAMTMPPADWYTGSSPGTTSWQILTLQV